MLPGDVQALAVRQGRMTLQFGVFGPAGAVAVLAWLGRPHLQPATHTHSKKAQADCSLPAMTTSLNIQPLVFPGEDYHIDFSQDLTGALQ